MSKLDSLDIAELASSMLEGHSGAFYRLVEDVMVKAENATDCGEIPQELYDTVVESVTQKLFDGIRNTVQQAVTELEEA